MADQREQKNQQFSGELVKVVAFRLGGEEYGVDIAQVQEIIRLVEITDSGNQEHANRRDRDRQQAGGHRRR